MTDAEGKRLDWIDLLRVVAALAVVVQHVAATLATDKHPAEPAWWIGSAVDSAVRWAVPVFVIISGALLLHPAGNEPPWTFLARRARRVLMPFLFWSAVYLLLRAQSGGLTAAGLLQCITGTRPAHYHLWFLYMIVGLYLLTPPLRRLVGRLSPPQRLCLVVVILAAAGVYYTAAAMRPGRPDVQSKWLTCIPYAGYFLCGHQLRVWNLGKIRTVVLLGVLAAGVGLLSAGSTLIALLAGPPWTYVCRGQFSLPVILTSICLFVLFSRIDCTAAARWWPLVKVCRRVAPATLGIYIVHPIALGILEQTLGLSAGRLPWGMGIAVTSAAVFVLSYAITRAMIRVPYLGQVVGLRMTRETASRVAQSAV